MIETLMIERGNKIYHCNELHSIVKYKHSSISGRSPTWGNEENYIVLLVGERSANLIS